MTKFRLTSTMKESIFFSFQCLLLFLLLGEVVIGQPLTDFEAGVKTFLEKIENNIHGDRDSLEAANHNFSLYLKNILPIIPGSLSPLFRSPNQQLWTASSADQQMRIWSWNTYTGGSMPAITNLIEFKTARGIQTVDLQEDLGWGPKEGGWNHEFDTIFMTQSNSKKYYLAKGRWRASRQDVGSEVVAFEITDTLNTDVRIFKIKRSVIITESDTLPQSCISISGNDCPPPKITMNSKATILKLQHIGDSKKGDVLTSKWDVYQFDGKYFVYKGLSKK